MEVLVSLVMSLALVELYAWLPALSKWLLNMSVRRLPESQRERCSEEWSAALDALPNTLAKLSHAVSFVVAAERLKSDEFWKEVRGLFDELSHNSNEASAALSTVITTFDSLRGDHGGLATEGLDQADVQALDGAWQYAKKSLDDQVAEQKRLFCTLGRASRNLDVFLAARERPYLACQAALSFMRLAREIKTLKASSTSLQTDRSFRDRFKQYRLVLDEIRSRHS